MRVVKAFGRELLEQDKFDKEAQTLFTNSYQTNRIQAKYGPVINFIWAVATVATAWFGATQILHGNLTVGQLTQFMLYLTMLQLPVRSLGFITMFWARAATRPAHLRHSDAESAVRRRKTPPS
jgi:ATP-binding cassette subfamily B protein